jgi:hypothetical protein
MNQNALGPLGQPRLTSTGVPPSQGAATLPPASIPSRSSGPVQRAIQIPLGTAWATLQAPFPLTQETWDLMLTVLEAMKPGLIQRDVAPAPPTEPPPLS